MLVDLFLPKHSLLCPIPQVQHAALVNESSQEGQLATRRLQLLVSKHNPCGIDDGLEW